jgi:hypothetical protein
MIYVPYTRAKPLHFGMQGQPTLWAEVAVDMQPDLPNHAAQYAIIGTGSAVPQGWRYVGTTFDSGFVWHLYETKPPVDGEPDAS